MLGWRIEPDVVDDLLGLILVNLRLAGDDLEAIRKIPERVRRHERVLETVRADVVGGAAPVVPPTRCRVDRMAGTPLRTFAASVAEMRRNDRIGFEFGIRQDENISHERTEVVRQEHAVKTAFAKPALDRRRLEIHAVLRPAPAADRIVGDFGVRAIVLL